jgi:uncharacterized membrane protein YgdD (TMEM256/DUF423 family)
MLGGDGGVFSFGTFFAGSPAADPRLCPANTSDRQEPNGTCWSMAATPDGRGYWVLNGDTGVIYPFGDAGFFGDPAATFAGEPREFVPNGLNIVATPTGKGYWVLEAGLSGLGTVLAFGDAAFFGDTVSMNVPHAAEPVGMAATADGKGYWIVDSDGGVFSFGDAPFLGSMGGRHLNAPVVAMASTPDGKGYYLAASDGGVFAFGDAVFSGSMGGTRLNAPVVGVAVAPVSGGGYWLAAADGGVFTFGQAPFRGSLGATHLQRPIFAITASHAVS